MKFLLSLLSFALILSCQAQKKFTSAFESVSYQTSPCFGMCPIFKLTINADKTAVLEAEHFNFEEATGKGNIDKPREGTFTTTIKDADFEKLVSMFEAVNVKSLKDSYVDKNLMDASMHTFTAKYADGSSKTIKDQGFSENKDFDKMKEFISDLRLNQDWKKIK